MILCVLALVVVWESGCEMEHSLFVEGEMPRVHYAGSLEFGIGEPFYKSLHHHPDVTEILLICEGEGEYLIGGVPCRIESQSIVVYNQGVWHEESSLDHVAHRMLYVGFSHLELRGLDSGMFLRADAPAVIPLRHRFLFIEEKFREILQEYEHPSPESEFVSNHLLAVLLAELAREIHHKENARPTKSLPQVVGTVKHFIEENYSHPIELRDLAEAAYLSPFHLSRIFKRETGVSPMHYVQKYRMEVAKQFLSMSGDTVGEIGRRVGYQSETHFQNVFKRLVGLPPGKFRSLHRETNNPTRDQ